MAQLAKVKIQLVNPFAKYPRKASPLSAGWDLHSVETRTINPMERVRVRTGVIFEIPGGWYGRVAPRSGLAVQHGIDVLAGVIDSDYRGEIEAVLINLNTEPFEIRIGDKICQLVIEKTLLCYLEDCKFLSETERSEKGFGSSGN